MTDSKHNLPWLDKYGEQLCSKYEERESILMRMVDALSFKSVGAKLLAWHEAYDSLETKVVNYSWSQNGPEMKLATERLDSLKDRWAKAHGRCIRQVSRIEQFISFGENKEVNAAIQKMNVSYGNPFGGPVDKQDVANGVVRQSTSLLVDKHCQSHRCSSDLRESQPALSRQKIDFLLNEADERKMIRKLSIKPAFDLITLLEPRFANEQFDDFKIKDDSGARQSVSSLQLARLSEAQYQYPNSFFHDLINMIVETIFDLAEQTYYERVLSQDTDYLKLSEVVRDRAGVKRMSEKNRMYAGVRVICAGFATPVRHHFAYLRAAIELFPLQYGREIELSELLSVSRNTEIAGAAIQKLTMRQLLLLESKLFTRDEPNLDRQFVHCEKIRFPDLTHLWIDERKIEESPGEPEFSVEISEQVFRMMAIDYKIGELSAGCPAVGMMNKRFHALLHRLTIRFVSQFASQHDTQEL